MAPASRFRFDMAVNFRALGCRGWICSYSTDMEFTMWPKGYWLTPHLLSKRLQEGRWRISALLKSVRPLIFLRIFTQFYIRSGPEMA